MWEVLLRISATESLVYNEADACDDVEPRREVYREVRR